MPDDIAVKVDSVSKAFKLPHEKTTSIKSAVVNFYRRDRTYENQQVLKDIELTIKKGEFFGIVGRNGSGKSTLLKLLAGIYTPNTGSIDIVGKLVPFIELGVGFSPELTGRENVYLNGALLGFSRTEMDAMYDDIVNFAELKRFMDQKLKNYSSGMQVRLAFSIAIRAKGDILLLDEVLAVGDAAFQEKCFNYFNELKKNKQTVIFVSHDMESVKKYCNRVAFINKGQLVEVGNPHIVVPNYLKVFRNEAAEEVEGTASQQAPIGMSSLVPTDLSIVKIENITLGDENHRKLRTVNDSNAFIKVAFDIKAQKSAAIVPGVVITDERGESITDTNLVWSGAKPRTVKKDESVKVEFTLPNIYQRGAYWVSVNVVSDDLQTFYAWQNEALHLRVERKHLNGARVFPHYKVGFK